MLRALFEKTGNAAYISHLDLMRLFQRAFKRAGLPLTHTQGFNPRPSVSIALPMSLGVESLCELLDFDLEGTYPDLETMRQRLNGALIEGVRVRQIYEGGSKLKNLALLEAELTLEYDAGVPEGAKAALEALFAREDLTVEKKSKRGIQQQEISAMVRRVEIGQTSPQELTLRALVHCQDPALNPMQLAVAVETYLPHLRPDFVRCCRLEIFDEAGGVFR